MTFPAGVLTANLTWQEPPADVKVACGLVVWCAVGVIFLSSYGWSVFTLLSVSGRGHIDINNGSADPIMS